MKSKLQTFLAGMVCIFILIGCTSITNQSDISGIQTYPTETSGAIEEVFTQTVIPSFTPSQNPTATPTISPAQATNDSFTENFSFACKNPYLHTLEISPDGKWISVYCYDASGPSLKILSIDKATEWTVSYLEIYGIKHNSSEGNINLYHWSKDGNYAYITFFPQADGGGGYAFYEIAALYRIDLNTGELSETLPPGTSYRKFYSLGFSPNDRRFAYFEQNTTPFSLIIHDFQTGKDNVVALDSKYNTGGKLVWSDNSKLLVFSAVFYDIDTDIYSGAVFLWDNEQKILKKLIDDSENVLIPVKWNSESVVALKERFTIEETEYEFDLNNQILVPVTKQ